MVAYVEKKKVIKKKKKRRLRKKTKPRPVIKITGDNLEVWGFGLSVLALIVDALILVAIFLTASWYQ